jgi:hypothetical protein
MTSTGHLSTDNDDQPRARLLELVSTIEPWDSLERTHLKTAAQWIASKAPVYRVHKPDVPAMHLVSYATASPITGELPLFLTVTETRGQGAHTDVSLWYVLTAGADTITSYDHDEFSAIRWLTDEQVLAESGELLDPHMHRFTHKLQHARAGKRCG